MPQNIPKALNAPSEVHSSRNQAVKAAANKVRNTLFWKFSFGILLTMLFLTITGFYMFDVVFERYTHRGEQVLNWSLAKAIKPQIEEALANGSSYYELQNLLASFLLSNPHLVIYLLDEAGNILADSGGDETIRRQTVPVEPIEDFLTKTATSAPIFNIDPRDHRANSIFSADRIKYQDQNGFLYVILSNENHRKILSVSKVDSIFSLTHYTIFVLMMVSGSIAILMFKQLTKRLRHIGTVLNEFGLGDFSKRVELKAGKDEISEIAVQVNSMADAIVQNVEELKKRDALRRELIANVSHDLRSPTAVISGLNESILLEAEEISPLTRRRSELIEEHCKSLSRLLSELFELAKIEAREIKPNFAAFSIVELLEELVGAYAPLAAQRKISLQTELIGKVPEVYGDCTMIHRVLTNLVDNALRYTPEDGVITLGAELMQDEVIIKVADTGAGIPEEDLPHVFERLYQVQHKTGLQNGLSGLGLAIVRKIIETHGKEITVSSSVNQGTTFSFKLDVA